MRPKGDAARARTAFAELAAAMRDLRRRTFFMPPLTEGDFANLGLQPPDTIRTPHIDVPEMAPRKAPRQAVWMTTTKRTHKGVDELNPNVVAQGNVTMTNKSKASFRMPTVR